MNWFRSSSEKVRVDAMELRVAALEARISSASDILEATERMDRVIKRSFRLKAQMDQIEKNAEEAPVEAGATISSRAQLLRSVASR